MQAHTNRNVYFVLGIWNLSDDQIKRRPSKSICFFKTVQMETDQGQFQKMLQELLAYLQNKYPSFHNYFRSNYISNNKDLLWHLAPFRLRCRTDMHAEAFHRVLKVVYFTSKQHRKG